MPETRKWMKGLMPRYAGSVSNSWLFHINNDFSIVFFLINNDNNLRSENRSNWYEESLYNRIDWEEKLLVTYFHYYFYKIIEACEIVISDPELLCLRSSNMHHDFV